MWKIAPAGFLVALMATAGCKPSDSSSVKTLGELASGKRDSNKNCSVRYAAEPDVKFAFTPTAKKNEAALSKAILQGLGSVPPALQKIFFTEMGGGIIVGDEYQSECNLKKNIEAGIPLASCINIEPEAKGVVIKLPPDSALITRDVALSIFYAVGNVLLWNFEDKRVEYFSRLNPAFALDLAKQGLLKEMQNPKIVDINSVSLTVAIFANAVDSLTCSEKTAKDMREKFKNTALVMDNMRDWLDVDSEIGASAQAESAFSLAGSGTTTSSTTKGSSTTRVASSSPSSSRSFSNGPLIGPYRADVLTNAGQTYIPANRNVVQPTLNRPITQQSAASNPSPGVLSLQRLAAGGPTYTSKQYDRDTKAALRVFPADVVRAAQWQGSKPVVPSKEAIKRAADFSKNQLTTAADIVAFSPLTPTTGKMPKVVEDSLKWVGIGTKGSTMVGNEGLAGNLKQAADTGKSFAAPLVAGAFGVPAMMLALPNLHLQSLADPNNPINKGIERQQTQRAKRAAIPLTESQKQDIISGRMPTDSKDRFLEGETVLRFILENPNLPYRR
jgi:hypothetical protein